MGAPVGLGGKYAVIQPAIGCEGDQPSLGQIHPYEMNMTRGKSNTMKLRKKSERFRIASLLAAAGISVTACGSASSASSGSTQTTSQAASHQSTPSPSSPSTSNSLQALVPSSLRSAGAIVFGAPETSPPMLYMNSSTQALEGVDYGLGEAIGKELGLRVKFVNTPFDGLIPGLDAGKFDVALGAFDDLPAREKLLTFVDYVRDGAVLIVQAGNPHNISTLSSLCGKTLALIQGSVQVQLVQTENGKCAEAGKAAIQPSQYTSPADALLAVKSGREDAFFASLPAALYHQKVDPSLFSYPTNTKIYAPTFIGAGVPRNNLPLAKAILAAIQQMVADGTYQQILASNGYAQGALKSTEIKINGGASYSPTATSSL